MKRRTFIRDLGLGSMMLATGAPNVWGKDRLRETVKLTILHTNDTHSRMEPFDSGRYEGLGGVVARAAKIEQIRAEEDWVLLLDAGDIFQGTPYFNFFEGEVEIKAMTAMQYDAATIGNHDFDLGLEGFDKQLKHANFPFVIANYDFSDTILDQKTQPYQIFEHSEIKVGVMGLGIELEGLVLPALYGGTRYMDPIEVANKTARFLKKEAACDYVVVLSHLGYQYREDKYVSDRILAKESEEIDLIIGGHTHTFLEEPEILGNKNGRPIILNQVGWAGIMLGKIDILFERGSSRKCLSCKPIMIGG